MANEDSPQEQPKLPEAKISFFVKNDPASQAMARRKVKPRGNKEGEAAVVSWNWYDTMQDAHKRAFVVAKMTKADLLTDVHDSLQKALDEGWSFEHWKKEIVPKLEGKWLGRSVGELWDELSEEEKAKREEPTEEQRKKIISPKRLETIFYTNMRVSNAAGHYEQLMRTKDLYPYWKYVTEHDSKVRDAHRALHNKVFKWDDPFWETYFPPNGFRCRCHVVPMDKYDLEDEGLRVQTGNVATDGDGRKVLDIDGRIYRNDIGWDYNPGKGAEGLVDLAKSNAKGRPAEVQADLEADLAKKEAEEQRKAAEAAARAEAERLAQEAAKARAEAERKAQEIEQRLQEAQARAAQRQAQHRAKQAQEAERREKEAEKRRQAAEAAAQKEALQETQRREAERLRDLEVQKVLQRAREVQGTPAIRQTVKPAKTKFDTYVVQNKVRLRKDTPVPAKEERKVVNLASDLIYQRKFEHNNLLGVANLPVNVMSKAKNSKVGGDFEYYTGLKSIKNSKRNTERASIKPTTRDFDRFNHLAETALPPEPSQQSNIKEFAERSFNPKYRSIEEAQKAIHNATREHAVFFDENGNCLDEFIGSKNRVTIGNNLKKGTHIVIHNHPSGNIFSADDIIWAMQNNIHELRVLCKGNGIYSFSPAKCDIKIEDVEDTINTLAAEMLRLIKPMNLPIDSRRRFVRIYISDNFPGIKKIM